MAAPTLAFTPLVTSLVPASGGTRAFAGASIQSGDELRVLAGTESDQNTPSNFRLAAPTNDGAALTWTLEVAVEPTTSGLWAPVYMWRAVGDTTRTIVVTLNRAGSTGTSIGWGGVFLGFRGSGGIGTFTSTNASTGFPSLSLTTTVANSSLAMVVGDWSSSATAGVWSTVGGTSPTVDADYGDGTNWAFHVAHVLDAGSAASKTFAMSAPSGQKWTAIAFEVKGTGGGGGGVTVKQLSALGVG